MQKKIEITSLCVNIFKCVLVLSVFVILGCEEKIYYDKKYQHIGKTVTFDQPLLYLKDSYPGALDSNSNEIQYWLVRQNGEEAIPQVVLDQWDESRPSISMYIKLDANTKFVVDSRFTHGTHGWKSIFFGEPIPYIVLRDQEGRVSDIMEIKVQFN